MKVKDVLVVGAGIAGCAVALALAKRGVPVTIVTSSFDQRAYHAPFIQHGQFEDKLKALQLVERENCSRAMTQLVSHARKSVDELLESHYLVDRNGNVDIHRCLQEQLKQLPDIEWIANHSFIELLTLDKHSLAYGDVYKKPSCLGAVLYHHATGEVETILAKEVILATGGATSLFPYSTHPAMARGGGLSIAHRAGVRLLNMENIQFHPLGLYEKDKPCFPLPLELLQAGGKLHVLKSMPSEDIGLASQLSEPIYDALQAHHVDHLWLDLTILDPVSLKDKFPAVDTFCLNHGFNIAKDPLPIIPVARYTGGGIAVDRTGQTSLQRLRALGEVACTGLFYEFCDEAISVLESLTWATACAEDVVKHLSKFIYYFPELKERDYVVQQQSESILQEDWYLLKHLMWHYVGIKRDKARLKRGCMLLEELQRANCIQPENLTIDQIHFSNALQTALLIARAAQEASQTKLVKKSLVSQSGVELVCQAHN